MSPRGRDAQRVGGGDEVPRRGCGAGHCEEDAKGRSGQAAAKNEWTSGKHDRAATRSVAAWVLPRTRSRGASLSSPRAYGKSTCVSMGDDASSPLRARRVRRAIHHRLRLWGKTGPGG